MTLTDAVKRQRIEAAKDRVVEAAEILAVGVRDSEDAIYGNLEPLIDLARNVRVAIQTLRNLAELEKE